MARYSAGIQVLAHGRNQSFLVSKCTCGSFSNPRGGSWLAPIANTNTISKVIVMSSASGYCFSNNLPSKKQCNRKLVLQIVIDLL